MDAFNELHSVKRNILYYPTINIPTNGWLKNAVLYWDEVSSIVPQDWEDKHLIKLSADIEYLMKENQFRAIKPETLMTGRGNWEMLQDFQNEFVGSVNSPKFKRLIERKKVLLTRLYGGELPKNGVIGDGSRIHQNKTNDMLVDFLENQNLARWDHEKTEWLLVENSTALLYMALLAKYLAKTDQQHTVIGTDLALYEEFNFPLKKKGGESPIISCDLKGLIPSPAKNVSLKSIINFKRMRESNLISFRKILLDIQNGISAAESNEHLKEIVISFQEEMRKGLIDMASVYKDSKIDLVFNSLKSLVNYKSSTAVTGAALLLNEKFKVTGLPSWVEAIAIVAAGAIDIGTFYIDARSKQRAADRQSAFSYLYHAQRKGIVNRFD